MMVAVLPFAPAFVGVVLLWLLAALLIWGLT